MQHHTTTPPRVPRHGGVKLVALVGILVVTLIDPTAAAAPSCANSTHLIEVAPREAGCPQGRIALFTSNRSRSSHGGDGGGAAAVATGWQRGNAWMDLFQFEHRVAPVDRAAAIASKSPFPLPMIAEFEGCIVWAISPASPAPRRELNVAVPKRYYGVFRDATQADFVNSKGGLATISDSAFVAFRTPAERRMYWPMAAALGTLPVPCDSDKDCERCVDDAAGCLVGVPRALVSNLTRLLHFPRPGLPVVRWDAVDEADIDAVRVALSRHVRNRATPALVTMQVLRGMGGERSTDMLVVLAHTRMAGLMPSTILVGLLALGIRVVVPLTVDVVPFVPFLPGGVALEPVTSILRDLANGGFDGAIFLTEQPSWGETRGSDVAVLLDAARNFFQSPARVAIIDDSGDTIDAELCRRTVTFVTELHPRVDVIG